MTLSIFFYFFFTIGISGFSKKIFREIISNKVELNKFPIPISPVLALISLILFCSFSNLLLLIPFFVKTLSFSKALIIHSLSFAEISINLASIFFSILGIFYSLIQLKIIKLGNIKFKYKSEFFNLSISFIISSLIYFLLAPKKAEFILFDTGYYHYPLVQHLSTFGIEKGITNFFPAFGVYNLNFFGQVPFHNLFSNSQYLSPSINIIFLSFYIWFFIEEFLFFEKTKYKFSILNIPYKKFVASYFIISFIFNSSSVISTIASYSANIPIFIIGSISFYIIFSSSLLKVRHYNYISVFLITIYAPLLKISALTIGLLNFSFFCIYMHRNNKFKKLNNIKANEFVIFCFNSIKRLKVFKNSFLIILICYLIACITNIIWSGYIFFPSTFLGPIGNHAMDISTVNALKDMTLNWHRYSGNIPISGASKNILDWFPIFITSRNGFIIIIYWIFPNLISLLINNKHLQKGSISIKNGINLNDYAFIISSFTFINIVFLITAPSYTPWLTPVIFFITFFSFCTLLSKNNLILKFQKVAIYSTFTLFLIFSLKLSVSNQVIIKNLFKNTFTTKFPEIDYKTIKIKTKKWKPMLADADSTIKINLTPNVERCWNVPSPCVCESYYKKNLVN